MPPPAVASRRGVREGGVPRFARIQATPERSQTFWPVVFERKSNLTNPENL